MPAPYQAIKLKYFFYRQFISLRLLFFVRPFSIFLPLPPSASLFIYLFANRMNEHSLSFLFHPNFPAAARIFSQFLFFPLRNSFLTSVYPPFLLHAHFSLPTAVAKSPHHSAAHKGGLRVPVSSTYDPNPAPYFFERLEKHAVTAVHVIACAQGASRLSVRRDRHVGHSWVTRRRELGVQSTNKVSWLINICKLLSLPASN